MEKRERNNTNCVSYNKSYVGYYADFEDEKGNKTPDGIPDGIIYADLAVGTNRRNEKME